MPEISEQSGVTGNSNCYMVVWKPLYLCSSFVTQWQGSSTFSGRFPALGWSTQVLLVPTVCGTTLSLGSVLIVQAEKHFGAGRCCWIHLQSNFILILPLARVAYPLTHLQRGRNLSNFNEDGKLLLKSLQSGSLLAYDVKCA